MKRFTRLAAICLVLVAALGLVGSISAQGSVLVIAFEQEPPNLWPLNTLTFGGVLESIYARDLWNWDVDRNIYPIMVDEIPTFENGGAVTNEAGDTVVTVTLKEGLQWSDGTPITTADCELTHRIWFDNTTSDSVGRGQYPSVVKSFEAVDERTFVLTYNGSFPDYLTAVNERPKCLYPAHIFGPMLENGGKLENDPYFTGGSTVVSYGPYNLARWNIGQDVTFERNPYWQGNPPAFDTVIVRFVTNSEQMVNALAVGDVDVTFNWSDNLQPTYAAIEGVETFNVPSVYSDALWIRSGPLGSSPEHGGDALQDPLVRQAIVHAIDRELLVEELVGEGVPVPLSWYPQGFIPDDLPYLEYDPDLAVSLLAEAGWTDTNGDGTVDKDGIELTNLRLVSTENTLRNNYQLVVQEALAEIGIGTEIQIIPATTLFASFADRGTLTTFSFDLAIFANSANAFRPIDTDSYTCAGIPSAENPDGFNGWQFCNERYDELQDLLATTFPGPERDAMWEESVRLFHEGYFWHGLRVRVTWFAVDASAVDPASVAANVGSLDSNWLNQIENWTPPA